jgi:hypothetical protein
VSGENATDAAVQLAEENDIDLSTVEGTGEGGKIRVPDVQAAIDERDEAEETPEEEATEEEKDLMTTSDSASRLEGTTASETDPDPSQGPHASDAGSEAYPFPTQGDVDVETIDPGTGEGEHFVPPNVDDWVLLDGTADEVDDRFDGHRAVILAVVTDPPNEPVEWANRDEVTLTVRTRDEANATFDIPFSAVKEVIKGGVSGTVRG